ncbi:DUF6289 family protein [Brevundimonas sp.]|uniref:DUF6289 family protein n=1 Tax=Brevundimonas sp. TaxID=1871086 RepID=UPI002D6AEE5B|nr:DUF6289 family protein [Brevundimonas sp.]HYC69439.1 DUF6289 family protein [Brevundimonas sp.]
MMFKSLRIPAVRSGKATALVLAVAAVVGASAAMAYPARSIEVEYFSDATYNDPVGGRGITCGGNQWRWGETTEYAISYSEPCG